MLNRKTSDVNKLSVFMGAEMPDSEVTAVAAESLLEHGLLKKDDSGVRYTL